MIHRFLDWQLAGCTAKPLQQTASLLNPTPSKTPTTGSPPPAATFKALAAKFDFAPYSSLLDIGGSAGTLACTVAAAHPHLRCTTADLPVLLPAAEATIEGAGLGGRVAAAAVDFFEDDFEKADVVTMSMILHDCELPVGLLRCSRIVFAVD